MREFENVYGSEFYDTFFRGMNSQTNDGLPWDGTDAAIWRYVRDRFDLAAGEDTTPIFELWGVPLE